MAGKDIKLPSGAILKIQASPFAIAKDLYQILLHEMKSIEINSKMQMMNVYKDLFCIGYSSPSVEAALWKCFERCTYNSGAGDFRITEDTFEPVKNREDYMTVCMEVAKENVAPFGKSLYAEYKRFAEMIANTPK